MSMIDAYDKKTGDSQWPRQSLQILQEELSSVQRTKSQMDEANRGANASGDSATTAQKDLQSRDAG
jgi:hypothetical protein